ncbi:uncharacterized protein [Aquarana catesbeiana]|uniref:uncharacterized protein isoform X1 n=2 Tax=Aquarana catesbeiana TaxID=8400 RepID=UPI003CC98D17
MSKTLVILLILSSTLVVTSTADQGLKDSCCQGDITAQIQMTNVQGSVTIDTNTWTLRTNLSTRCATVNISIHEFPVIYGASQDPCDIGHIGQSSLDLSLKGTTQVVVDRNMRYDGRSLFLKTCGLQTCVNLDTGAHRVWKAVVHSFILGQVYFLQPSTPQPITVVMELGLLEEMAALNASLFFSDACQGNNVQLLGSAQVNHQKFAKSRLELNTAEVMPYLVIKYQERWACAELKLIQTKEVSAQFSMKGVEGSFSFKQESPFHPTQLSINLWRLRGLAGQYRIHSLPVRARHHSDQNLCDEGNTGSLWNPLSVSTANNRGGHTSWPIGDLSGRHGTLQGREAFSAVLTDWNLPLFGNNSVTTRSVLILKASGEPWACSTINLEGEVVTALASFRKGVVGKIMFQQATSDPYNDLTVYIELSQASDSISKNHNWHIHEIPLTTESKDCASAGGHFNPYNVSTGGNYSQECKPSNPMRCEAGDYAGRLVPITLLAPFPARYLFTDSLTSLTGPTSIIGRSVVIHESEGRSPRVACANILLQPIFQGRTDLWSGSGNAGGELGASQVSEFTPTVIDVNFNGLSGLAGGFHIHQLPVTAGSDNPCSDQKIRGHFNPFLVNMTSSPAVGNGTDDEYELGDISGRHGSLLNLDNKIAKFRDMNLPLSGPHSALGRSLVIHYVNGSRMHCATFQHQLSSDGEWVRVSAEFSGVIRGRISLSQIVYPNGGSSDTTILVDLQPASPDKNLSWSIRTQDSGGETYNPYEIPNQGGNWSWCGPQVSQHCRVGDLVGKHGPISPRNRLMFTDSNLPLAGDFTVVSRTLALSWDSLELSSMLLPDVSITSLKFQKVTPFDRSALRGAVSAALGVPLWKVTVLPQTTEEDSCLRVQFFVIGFNDTSNLNALQAQESLGPFCTSTLCCPGSKKPSGSNASGISTSIFLIIASLVLSQLLLANRTDEK